MKYTRDDVMQYVKEEDVKFIRLSFCDVYGNQMNTSIMPAELSDAFDGAVWLDAARVGVKSHVPYGRLYLRPDPSTLSVLPWRPDHGRVMRMFCSLEDCDGNVFSADTRTLLIDTIKKAKERGCDFTFSSRAQFYLFSCDENGAPTDIPYDTAGYMDIAPEDRGENVRREICLSLEQMGITPLSSHHEAGPGQNEIIYRPADALRSADDAVCFRSVVKTIAARNGLFADFSPLPMPDAPANGMNIGMSDGKGETSEREAFLGIIARLPEITAFLNPSEQSYARLKRSGAPASLIISDSEADAAVRMHCPYKQSLTYELMTPDSSANPYIVYTLMIKAALEGLDGKTNGCESLSLPHNLSEAKRAAAASEFISSCLPHTVIDAYTAE